MLQDMARGARKAGRHLAQVSSQQKNELLLDIADLLDSNKAEILAANQKDVDEARADGMSSHLIDRLILDRVRLASISKDLRGVVNLEDPTGEVFEEFTAPSGLEVKKVRVPLGVIAVIYEARPNVTIDVVGLALKTGNAVILRGGSETIRTNRVLVQLIKKALRSAGLPEQAVHLIDSPDRALVSKLLKMHHWIDMLIPRGGAGLHKYCRENSTIPVITGGIGICHLFVDKSADLDAAVRVIQNAKVQRPSVCNALDTLLVHREIADEFLPRVVQRLDKDGVEFRTDQASAQILKDFSQDLVRPAGPDDFDTEWLSLVLGLRVVDSLDEAVDLIALHSTSHSDGILTRDEASAECFVRLVDSACVYVNASTRFTDGSQLGLGAEVAISTQRLHARGPMALRELTTYKWVIKGKYHIRE